MSRNIFSGSGNVHVEQHIHQPPQPTIPRYLSSSSRARWQRGAGRFPDGIIFHSFYHQPSTDMALQTICNAFQVEAKAGLPCASTVRQVLAGRKALLILDGAEEADDLPAVLALRMSALQARLRDATGQSRSRESITWLCNASLKVLAAEGQMV